MGSPCLCGEDSFGVVRYSRRDNELDGAKYMHMCCIFVELDARHGIMTIHGAPWGAANRKS